jgi:hypothetical protein
MNRTSLWLPPAMLALALAATSAAGCDDKPATPLAPTSTALQATKPATAGAKKFTVDKASSKVDFTMEAPQEKIRGRVPGATEGELQIDPTDLTKATGLLTVDISGIEVYQTKMDDDAGKFGEETKSDLQNTHVRNWLEIAGDVPEDVRKKNSRVEFALRSVDSASQKDVSKMTGPERKVTIKATGDFLLHGRKTQKTAELEVTFRYDGDTPKSISVKSVKPFVVGLDEHDVKPREKWGVLAQKTLAILSPKVAKDAEVSVDLTASLAPGGAATMPSKAP